jgi:beta-lactamase regulating signal transducer with metallopeptidase domain
MSLFQPESNVAFLWPLVAGAAIKSAALLLAAAALALAMRKASAAARHWLWLLALCSILTLPFLSITLPQWKILPPQSAPEPTISIDALPSTDIAPLPNSAPTQSTQITPSPTVTQSSPLQIPDRPVEQINLPACAVLAWAIGSTVMLTPMLLGIAALFRLASRSKPIADEACTTLLARLSSQLAIAAPVRLLQSDRRTMPMIWGIRRPTILLPTDALAWPDQRLRLVLLHELAHVKRRDGLTQLIAQFARAVYWFNPLAWFAFHRLEVERERACDDIVLTAGNKPSDYAAELLAVATGSRSLAIAGLVAAPMARPSGLENRLRAILDMGQSRQHSTRRAIAIGVAALLLVLLPLVHCHSSK